MCFFEQACEGNNLHSSRMSATRYLEPMGRDVRHNSCFKGLFMHRLLTKGYHFQQWEDISIVKRVADSEVGWTLGYMIQRSNSAVSTTGMYMHFPNGS